MQANVLDRCPDDREAARLGREDINLIGALTHIAKETFDGIGGLNMPMHGLRKLVKGQEVLFILSQTSHRLWIALSVLGFEGCQLCQCLLLIRLLPDTNEFGLHIAALSARDGVEDIALLMH